MEIRGNLKSRILSDRIREQISLDGLKPGDPILSENSLAEKFNISRVTVRKGIADLVAEGILYKVRGKGTFVSKTPEKTGCESLFNKSKSVAFISPCITNSYFANIARGLEDYAFARGVHVVFRSTDANPESESAAIDRLFSCGVGGVVLVPSESNPLSLRVRNLLRASPNLVIVNDLVVGESVSVVASDDFEGGYLATKHLLELGHRRIAHLRGPQNILNARARENGYIRALEEFSISICSDFILGDSTYGMEEGYENMKDLLSLPKMKRPTAVFAASDLKAVGAFRAAADAGISVPDDLAIVGYGDLSETTGEGCDITSVRQKGYEIGENAAELIIGRLRSSVRSDANTKRILISPELIERSSSLGDAVANKNRRIT